jgi:hypothetical protein
VSPYDIDLYLQSLTQGFTDHSGRINLGLAHSVAIGSRGPAYFWSPPDSINSMCLALLVQPECNTCDKLIKLNKLIGSSWPKISASNIEDFALSHFGRGQFVSDHLRETPLIGLPSLLLKSDIASEVRKTVGSTVFKRLSDRESAAAELRSHLASLFGVIADDSIVGNELVRRIESSWLAKWGLPSAYFGEESKWMS